jgi:bacteriorhodopsin
MYPLFSALGETSGVISANAETAAFTILDVLTKVGFGLWLLLGHNHSKDEHGATLPAYWIEVRGAGVAGVIQLPVSE